MRLSTECRLALMAGLLALAAPMASQAQVPPPASPEATEIAACLCLHRSIDALSANMAVRQHSYDDARAQIGRLDSELQTMRASMDVNNPEAVARFRQLLQRRDALFRHSNGPLASDLSTVVSRYNAATGEYNTRCANRPQDPVLIGQVRETLSCQAP
jgi:hypothetical protein